MSKEYAREISAMTCDMCGTRREQQEGGLSNWQEIIYEKSTHDGHRCEYSNYMADICPDCAAQVGKWIEQQAKKNGVRNANT